MEEEINFHELLLKRLSPMSVLQTHLYDPRRCDVLDA